MWNDVIPQGLMVVMVVFVAVGALYIVWQQYKQPALVRRGMTEEMMESIDRLWSWLRLLQIFAVVMALVSVGRLLFFETGLGDKLLLGVSILVLSIAQKAWRASHEAVCDRKQLLQALSRSKVVRTI